MVSTQQVSFFFLNLAHIAKLYDPFFLLVCAGYLVISVIDPSGNWSKLTSDLFSNNDAHLKII